MHLRDDSVSIFDLGPAGGRAVRRVEHLGRAPEIADADAGDSAVIW